MHTSRLSARYDHNDLTEDNAKVLSIQNDRPSKYRLEHPTLIRHLEAACFYGGLIEQVASHVGLLPSIIAGFGSRQSGWGTDLSPPGPSGMSDFTPRRHRTKQRRGVLPPDGDGFARGLMQLDYDDHDLARSQEWRDPEANIEAACRAIIDGRAYLRKRTTLQGQGLLRAAFAAFDCSLERVLFATRQGLDVDHLTAGQDYGWDILDRASFFQTHGWD